MSSGMVFKYIDVIDEDFDVSIDLSMPPLWYLELEYQKRTSRTHCPSDAAKLTDFLDPTKSFSQNFTNYEAMNRQLSMKALPERFYNNSTLDPFSKNLPRYSPPTKEQILAFKIYSDAYLSNKYSQNIRNRRTSPKKPRFPVAKTNTNLANYVHKLYVYEQHLKDELKEIALNEDFDEVPILRSSGVKIHDVPSATSNIDLTLASPLSALRFESTSLSNSSSNSGSTIATTSTGSKILLKHHYNPDLGKAISRSLSKKSGRNAVL